VAEPRGLAALQRRFYDRVVAGADAGDLAASGSLEVYAEMYGARLIDALAADYPKLRVALGAPAFTALAEAYLRARPPRSFTLRDLGLALPAWLGGVATAPAWAADLAALERARVEIFDGPDGDALARDAVIALGDALPELALRWVPASQLVPTVWSVDELWSAIEDRSDDALEVHEAHDHAAELPVPVAAPRTILVWRHELAVLHRVLDPDEAELADRVAAGARFAELCDRLGGLHGEAAASRAVVLLLRWLDGGALCAVG